MKSIKGTQTEKNLLKAFVGECQARMKYDFFSSIAKKEGYVQISSIFQETALNEKEHAKRFFKFLEGGNIEITGNFEAGKLGNTLENLKKAAEGENEEWTDLYPKFGSIAREEGFEDIAITFEKIAEVEKTHEKRYQKLYKNILEGKVFKKDKTFIWKCLNCGYLHEGKQAPEICPACLHPQGYYEINSQNY